MRIGIIVIAVILNCIGIYLSYTYLEFRKKETHTVTSFFQCSWNPKRFGFCAGTGFAALLVFLYGRFLADATLLQCYLNMYVFQWLVLIAYIDWKEQIIPNQLILAGMVLWGIVTILEVWLGGTPIKTVLLFSLLGAGICGGILLIVAIIAKSALGMGDVKLFTVLGLLYGVMNTYSILIFTMIFMAVTSLILLAMKKVTVKTAIPMAPFVIIGFMVGVLAGM